MLNYNRDRSLHPGSRYIGRIPGVRLAHAEQGTVTDLAHRAIHNDASQTEYKAGGLFKYFTEAIAECDTTISAHWRCFAIFTVSPAFFITEQR